MPSLQQAKASQQTHLQSKLIFGQVKVGNHLSRKSMNQRCFIEKTLPENSPRMLPTELCWLRLHGLKQMQQRQQHCLRQWIKLSQTRLQGIDYKIWNWDYYSSLNLFVWESASLHICSSNLCYRSERSLCHICVLILSRLQMLTWSALRCSAKKMSQWPRRNMHYKKGMNQTIVLESRIMYKLSIIDSRSALAGRGGHLPSFLRPMKYMTGSNNNNNCRGAEWIKRGNRRIWTAVPSRAK